MRFEYDSAKSLVNKEKHGLDFTEAQVIWRDPAAIRFPSVANSGEERWVVLGRIGEKLWAAAVTYRGDAIRIISVRRARKEEVAAYEKRNTH